MDEYKIIENAQKKISVYILICFLIIFLLFSLNQCNRNRQLKNEISKIRTELKKDYEEKIKKREIIIEKLKKDNDLKKREIDKINNSIDSLDKVKNKIMLKYKYITKEIKIMDSEKIKKYWYEEFN
jgi:hypothetical protein